MIGQTLSHFQITDRLGEGGMGTVYRGRDTRLGREVAIKVLPEAFTADAERLARFEREARLLASLNHPSIAGIYEVGHVGEVGNAAGVHFLVMELAEGENLAERLARGPMTVQEALPVARRIAEALEAAHRSGVVHRDLKPANVMLAPDGRVKVLDFGLAKAMASSAGAAGDLSLSPTLTAQMTSAGIILGTAAYMSPEQAKGEEADKRSDIWSFGVVLWEMLAGRKTFQEKTVSETLAAVLKSNPDLSVLPATVPLAIRRLIERCLKKDPDQRLHDIADARLEIESVLRGDDSALVVGAAEGPSASPGPWKAVALAASAVALLALASHLLPRGAPVPTAERLPVSFRLDRPPVTVDTRGPSVAVSADGRRLAYRWSADDFEDEAIYLRELGSVDARRITGTDGGVGPFFSPDGTRLGFARLPSILTVSTAGGAPKTISDDIGNYRGGTWADDDTIWYSPDTEAGLWRMRSDGGEPVEMTHPDASKGERSHRWPAVLPGSDIVFFTVATSAMEVFDEARIDVLRVSTGERKTVIDGGTYPVWMEPDVLLYTYSGTLMATRFDRDALALLGVPVPVVEGLKTDPLSGSALVAGSVEGSLAAGLGPPLVGKRTVMRFDRDGSSVPVTEDVRAYQGLALSPDGSILALDIDAARAAIWLLDLERGIQTRLTSEWNHNAPAWSPDGRRIATSASQGGVYQVILHDLDRGTSEVVFESETDQIYATSWSKDDTLLASLFPVGEPPQIWTVPLDGSPPRLTLKGSGALWGPMVSPDGRWIAYTADESGSEEIYVAAASGEGPRTRVSSDGGAFPRWSRNGTELYFFGGKRAFGTTLMAASVTEGDRSQVGRPRALFDVPRLYPGSNLGLEVDSAGGFYVIESVPDPDEVNADLVFTRGWVESLRGKLADR